MPLTQFLEADPSDAQNCKLSTATSGTPPSRSVEVLPLLSTLTSPANHHLTLVWRPWRSSNPMHGRDFHLLVTAQVVDLLVTRAPRSIKVLLCLDLRICAMAALRFKTASTEVAPLKLTQIPLPLITLDFAPPDIYPPRRSSRLYTNKRRASLEAEAAWVLPSFATACATFHTVRL
ncbi:hypothetical protein NMY22_g6206 [Coprinellus aureogranulatus]|nr:hypothetical protein NMY22_g6206 [Coprinellus aureogranulatus]